MLYRIRFSSINLLVILAVIVSAFSCQGSLKTTNVDFDYAGLKDAFHLGNGDEIVCDSLGLLNPRWLRFHPDSFLIVQEMGTDPMIKILDLKTGRVQEMVKKGTGIGEMLVVWGIENIGNQISVFDGLQKKLYLLEPKADRMFAIVKEIVLNDKSVISVYPLSNKKYVGLAGIEQESRLVYFDDKGAVIDSMGDFPKLANENEFKADNNLFSSYIANNLTDSLLVLACTNVDFLEIYSSKGGLIRRIQGPEGLSVTARKVDIGVGHMMITDPPFKAFNSALGNESEFWLGYVGKRLEKDMRYRPEELMAKEVFCFNWNGEPIRRLSFESPLISFAVDWRAKKMYGLVLEKAPKIKVYNLRDVN